MVNFQMNDQCKCAWGGVPSPCSSKCSICGKEAFGPGLQPQVPTVIPECGFMGEGLKGKPEVKLLKFDAKEAYPDVVNLLEKLLEEAKSGELIGLATVAILSNQRIGSAYTSGAESHIFATIGALDYLKDRLMDCIEEA